MPYIIIGIVALMSYVTMSHQLIIVAFIVGLLAGVWMVILMKCIGTVAMKTFVLINIVVLVAATMIGVYITDIKILTIISPVAALLVPMNIIGYVVVNSNKPKIGMSYKYSYRNRRKRYF